MAEYYLAGTLKTEPPRGPPSITPAPRRGKIAPRTSGAAPIIEGHLAVGGTVAELRPDLSPALAARLGIADPGRARLPKPVLRIC